KDNKYGAKPHINELQREAIMNAPNQSNKTYQECRKRPDLETSRMSRSTPTEMAKPTKPKRKKPTLKPIYTENVGKKDRELLELPTKDL
ncbi:40525_t:CDS:2, partial [Gigaspora margarita]